MQSRYLFYRYRIWDNLTITVQGSYYEQTGSAPMETALTDRKTEMDVKGLSWAKAFTDGRPDDGLLGVTTYLLTHEIAHAGQSFGYEPGVSVSGEYSIENMMSAARTMEIPDWIIASVRGDLTLLELGTAYEPYAYYFGVKNAPPGFIGHLSRSRLLDEGAHYKVASVYGVSVAEEPHFNWNLARWRAITDDGTLEMRNGGYGRRDIPTRRPTGNILMRTRY